MSFEPNNMIWEERCIGAMRGAVSLLADRAPLLGQMVEYHLGWSEDFAGHERFRGKMIRPMIAVFAAEAVGGPSAGQSAIPLAAAIELLHNFTLIHDDIQDNSPSRRHRPTVWAKWGEAQAINAGDALFAAAHIALIGSVDVGVPAPVVVELVRGFDATTIEIVSGQVLDLAFEKRQDVAPDEYIEMITGKTARIVEFAAGGGGWVAGAESRTAGHLAEFGLALGMGFQVQDDLLGVFGKESDTGKAAADDIRRKKQSLPVLLLRNAVEGDDRDQLNAIYAQGGIDNGSIEQVLGLMDRYQIEDQVRARVAQYHDESLTALEATGMTNRQLAPLMDLIRRLETRTN